MAPLASRGARFFVASAVLGSAALAPSMVYAPAQAAEIVSYPIYRIQDSGLSAKESDAFLEALKPRMKGTDVLATGSVMVTFNKASMEAGLRFIDEPRGVGAPGRDDEKGPAINSAEWDIEFLQSAPIVTPVEASSLMKAAFRKIDLGDKPLAPLSSYTTLEVVSPGKAEPKFRGPIGTAVARQSTLSGIPLVGPGQSATMNFGADGKVASISMNLHRLVKTADSARILVGAAGDKACAEALGGGVQGVKYSAQPVYYIERQPKKGSLLRPGLECSTAAPGLSPLAYYVSLQEDLTATLLTEGSRIGGISEEVADQIGTRSFGTAYLARKANQRIPWGWDIAEYFRAIIGNDRVIGTPVGPTSENYEDVIPEDYFSPSSGGGQLARVDNVDMAFASTHGLEDSLQINPGPDQEDARSQNVADMVWGGGDLEWILLNSCLFLTDAERGFYGNDVSPWGERFASVFDGVHLAFGYDTIATVKTSIGYEFAAAVRGNYIIMYNSAEVRRAMEATWAPGTFPMLWAWILSAQFWQPSSSIDYGPIRGAAIGTQGVRGEGGSPMDCWLCNLPDQRVSSGAELWRVEFGT